MYGNRLNAIGDHSQDLVTIADENSPRILGYVAIKIRHQSSQTSFGLKLFMDYCSIFSALHLPQSSRISAGDV